MVKDLLTTVIKADIMKIGDVPPLWRAEVRALLDADTENNIKYKFYELKF